MVRIYATHILVEEITNTCTQARTKLTARKSYSGFAPMNQIRRPSYILGANREKRVDFEVDTLPFNTRCDVEVLTHLRNNEP